MPGFFETNNKIRWIVFIVGLAGGGLYLALIGINDLGFVLNCRTTQGNIESVAKRTEKIHGRYRDTTRTVYLTNYSYDVGGFNYRHTETQINGLPEGPVQVYYDERNPAKCFLNKPSPALAFFMMILLLGGALLLGWVVWGKETS